MPVGLEHLTGMAGGNGGESAKQGEANVTDALITTTEVDGNCVRRKTSDGPESSSMSVATVAKSDSGDGDERADDGDASTHDKSGDGHADERPT